ncbi:pentatricopeptide repeat-containing protein At1g31790 [Gastrolobium bilobum]|uniref:pentatricopeptide repeat-containing protein At1g31790 n=1 Tax=Gastrolobium bilobum TaxID=150636 RepID=UPI002AB154F3|nr:pentatricopeptide repeat-containing protein At1g31790 [Gastrolobium bilobum]
MELMVAPTPTATTPSYVFFDDKLDAKNNNNISSSSSTCPSPNHHLELRLPQRNPKLNLSLFHNLPYHISSQPLQTLTPLTTILRKKNNNNKKKRKGATTLDILRLMNSLSFPIPIDIYTSLIKECTVSGDPETAIELHAHITRSGIKPPLPLLNRILIMFVSCGLLESARNLFDSMTVRDFNSWAILFVAYYDIADYEEAIGVFVSMLGQLGMLDFPPWIWACLLKACACTVNISLGMQVHGWLLKLGIYDHVLLSSSLISFYGRLKCLEDANVVFDQVSRHNTLTWTAKMISDCRERHFSEVLGDFKEMGRQGIKKDSFTFSSVLKACGKMLDHERCGEQVHADAVKLGLVSDDYVQCSLIAMYGRSGLLRDAKQMFEMTQNERKVDCWNAMLMGYIQNGLYFEAVKFLYQMKAAGMQPQESLLNKVRIACGSITYSSMN